MTSLMFLSLLLLLVEVRVSDGNAASKLCKSVSISYGHINCSTNPCPVTCNKGYFLFGPKTVKCINGVLVNRALSTCVGLRLVGGDKDGTSGRVQMKALGVFAYIWNYYKYMYSGSNKGWSIREASVVCRMLGFPNASHYIEFFPSTGGYWCALPYLKCKGDELSISECSNSELKVFSRYCRSSYSVGVVCGDPKISFRIKPFGKASSSSGRVEAYIGGVWGAVSYTGWTLEAGNVVCRMNGLPNATSIPEASIIDNLGKQWLQVKHCFGNESSLVDCSLHVYESPMYVYRGHEAGVICGQPNVSVRLTGLTTNIRAKTQELGIPRVGKVEMEIDGITGAIGNKYWNDNAATVVCRMLNISGPCVAPSIYDTRKPPKVWMDKVKCSGKEKSLLDCIHPGLRNAHQIGSSSQAVVAVGYHNPEISFRITEGNSLQEGKVEAYINDVMIFFEVDEDNEQNVSQVICRNHGPPSPIMFFRAITSVYLKDLVFKDHIRVDLQCIGNEKNISDCKKTFHSTWKIPFGFVHGVACKRDFQCPSDCKCKLVKTSDANDFSGMN